MAEDLIYNPLDKVHLAESVVQALLSRDIRSLPPEESFVGAGIYAIYYTGDFPAYKEIVARNLDGRYACPIYVGKAIPAGGRKGGLGLRSPGMAMYKRLREHSDSIQQASNLRIHDFACRYLIVDELWIPLGENLMIEHFKPLWNAVVDGFGNHDPGSGRYRGRCPSWDVLHPGRMWASKCEPNPKSDVEILENVSAYLTHLQDKP